MCGDGGSGVSERAEQQLELQVAGIRAAAAEADRNATTQQLALLRAGVDQLAADGDLTASAADRIREAATAVEDQITLLPAPTTTTTTTTTRPDPARRRRRRERQALVGPAREGQGPRPWSGTRRRRRGLRSEPGRCEAGGRREPSGDELGEHAVERPLQIAETAIYITIAVVLCAGSALLLGDAIYQLATDLDEGIDVAAADTLTPCC